jgi:hypothetical protein
MSSNNIYEILWHLDRSIGGIQVGFDNLKADNSHGYVLLDRDNLFGNIYTINEKLLKYKSHIIPNNSAVIKKAFEYINNTYENSYTIEELVHIVSPTNSISWIDLLQAKIQRVHYVSPVLATVDCEIQNNEEIKSLKSISVLIGISNDLKIAYLMIKYFEHNDVVITINNDRIMLVRIGNDFYPIKI